MHTDHYTTEDEESGDCCSGKLFRRSTNVLQGMCGHSCTGRNLILKSHSDRNLEVQALVAKASCWTERTGGLVSTPAKRQPVRRPFYCYSPFKLTVPLSGSAVVNLEYFKLLNIQFQPIGPFVPYQARARLGEFQSLARTPASPRGWPQPLLTLSIQNGAGLSQYLMTPLSRRATIPTSRPWIEIRSYEKEIQSPSKG